eukprot:Polyplicarium_translucidae@DN3361_c0_g1_i7.p2
MKLQVIVCATLASAAPEWRWTYTWPYGPKGECRCRPAPSAWGEHESLTDCLRAFANERYETCKNPSDPRNPFGTTTYETCEFAVSTFGLYDNKACARMCRDWMRTGDNFAFFEAVCQFEFTVVSRMSISLAGDCFQKQVFGHTDDTFTGIPPALHGVPREKTVLQIVLSVRSPIACQSICQETEDCEAFFYRALPGPNWDGTGCTVDDRLGSTGCPPRTCVLLRETATSLARKVAIPLGNEAEFGRDEDYMWQVCNLAETREHWRRARGMGAQDPLTDEQPLSEGCKWLSKEHVTGPRVCSTGSEILAQEVEAIPPPTEMVEEGVRDDSGAATMGAGLWAGLAAMLLVL